MDGPRAMNSVLCYAPLLMPSEHMTTAGFPPRTKRPRTSASSYANSSCSSSSHSSSSTSSRDSCRLAPLSSSPPLPLLAPYPVPPPAEPLVSVAFPATSWGGAHPRDPSGTKCASAVPAAAPAAAALLCASGATSNAVGAHGMWSSSRGADAGSMQGDGVAAMFVEDAFLPDDDATLYALWSASGSSDAVLGDENETCHSDSQQQQGQHRPPEAQSSLYLTSDEELKIDYPHLSEFHQDLDLYLNETMESGGRSPTTPLGTDTTCEMKIARLVTTDWESGTVCGVQLPIGTRDPLLERPLASETVVEESMKRYAAMTERESVPERLAGKPRGGHANAYAAISVGTSSIDEAVLTETVTSLCETLLKRSTFEREQRLTMPALGLRHGERSSLVLAPATISRTSNTPCKTMAVTPTVTLTSCTSSKPSAKAKKRPRSRQCEFPGCENRARSHQKCKKHGGAHHCVFEGCTKNSQSRGLCIAHGGGSRCKKEGCIRAAQSKGLCKSHGGGEYCAVDGCDKKAHLKHLCRTHGGGVRCKSEKCSKWAQRKGWCMAHAKEFASLQ